MTSSTSKAFAKAKKCKVMCAREVGLSVDGFKHLTTWVKTEVKFRNPVLDRMPERDDEATGSLRLPRHHGE